MNKMKQNEGSYYLQENTLYTVKEPWAIEVRLSENLQGSEIAN